MRSLVLFLFGAANLAAQPSEALQQLNSYLNQIGIAQVNQRAQAVSQLLTRAAAEKRQAEVRRKILDLIGGLPEHSGPVTVKQFATVMGDGFRIENIAYESLPGFYVTANVFVPGSAKAPYPAVVITPGHGAGKQSEYNWGANFARANLVALVIDPLGQGERFQHYDPDLENSKIERLGEHEHASLSALLIGDHVSRYFINDGMRGVDYLASRPDVNPNRIGAFGCSGGGTITAYLAALDPRVQAAASACYITSLKELFPTQGPQDAEQTLPRFAAEGLDFADWVELAAPRPYAIVSTTQDMFPYAGAQQTYEEAKRFYGLLGAARNLEWITGPGGHGNLQPIADRILTFLAGKLTGDSTPRTFQQFRPKDADDLIATPSGQVSISLDSRPVEALTREHAQGRLASPQTLDSASLAASRERIRVEVRKTAGIIAQGEVPTVDIEKDDPANGYRVQSLSLATEPGVVLKAMQSVVAGAGRKTAIVMLDEIPVGRTAASPEFQRLAKSGKIVIALQSRGTPIDAQNGQSTQFALGPYMAVNLRAIIVGKTLTGMRTDDLLRLMNWLASRPDVDASSVTVYGRGALGLVALHAAALDPRITRVITENTLLSYRMALDAPLHRNLSEMTIPGVLEHYDTGDLLEAIAPRPVALINPVDAIGQPVRLSRMPELLPTVFQTDRNLGAPERVSVSRRGFRDPLPIE